jgi:NAD(P) transhydrogenase subunit beta
MPTVISLLNGYAGLSAAMMGFVLTETAARMEELPVRTTSPEETALLLDSARLVVVVPGFGAAAAQAQHKIRELSDMLMRRGVEVRFAIHPVAGRMPGHMNVLLAEANIPYDLLFDLDAINPEFPQADACSLSARTTWSTRPHATTSTARSTGCRSWM